MWSMHDEEHCCYEKVYELMERTFDPGYKCLRCFYKVIPRSPRGMGYAHGAMVAHIKGHIERGEIEP